MLKMREKPFHADVGIDDQTGPASAFPYFGQQPVRP